MIILASLNGASKFAKKLVYLQRLNCQSFKMGLVLIGSNKTQSNVPNASRVFRSISSSQIELCVPNANLETFVTCAWIYGKDRITNFVEISNVNFSMILSATLLGIGSLGWKIETIKISQRRNIPPHSTEPVFIAKQLLSMRVLASICNAVLVKKNSAGYAFRFLKMAYILADNSIITVEKLHRLKSSLKFKPPDYRDNFE